MSRFFALVCLLLTGIGQAEDRPNIVVLFADDMGFSDIGCFGSEIQTPQLDKLAANGLRYTHFYNTGRCCPSRASILTGLYAHQADVGHMLGETGLRGYRDRLSFQAVTLAEVLGTAGYHTIMTGKWHLGWKDEGSPTARGFQHFYGTRGFIDSYFTVINRTEVYLNDKLVIPPTEHPENDLFPDREWYTTDVFTDYAIHFMNEVRKQDDEPFFLYLAYNAPHFPLHAKPEDTAKYRGKYREGWSAYRQKRYEKLVELGVLTEDWPLSPLDVPNWDTLSDAEKDDLDFKMALYAAVIDRLDQNIGRIVDQLSEMGELENTLLVFLSDNGGTKETGLLGIKGENNTVENYESWGRKGGWTSSYGQGWANLSNVPFRQYKRENHEGGISTPAIVHWPKGFQARGELRHQVTHLIDLMPTFVEVSGADYPKQFNGKEIQPMEGQSLMPSFRTADTVPRTLYWEHSGNRAVRDGDWKLVAQSDQPWELYHMANDRSELQDLSAGNRERFDALESKWDRWAEKVGVLTPAEFDAARKANRESQPKPKRSDPNIVLPPETKVEPGTGLISELFADADLWKTAGGQWTRTDGVYRVEGDNGPRTYHTGLNLRNFSLEVKLTLSKGSQAGVNFRLQDVAEGIDSYAGYYLGIHSGKNQIMLGAADFGYRTVQREPAHIKENETYLLKLTCEKHEFHAKVFDSSGKEIAQLSAKDGTFRNGLIGLRALGGGAEFSDLQIHALAK